MMSGAFSPPVLKAVPVRLKACRLDQERGKIEARV
jgi:hypothetical protein